MFSINDYLELYNKILYSMLKLGLSLLAIGCIILIIFTILVKKGKVIKDNNSENDIHSNYNQLKIFSTLIIGFSVFVILFSLLNIPIILDIKKDIINNSEVEEKIGTIIDTKDHGKKIVIDNQIYYIRDFDDDIVAYHIDNQIEVKFYYYRYSKCIQSIEWQEIPGEETS